MNPDLVLDLIVELLNNETAADIKGRRVEWNEPKPDGRWARRLVSKCHQSLDLEFEIRATVDANLLVSVECAWRILGGTEKRQIHRADYKVAAEAANLLGIKDWYEGQLRTCHKSIEDVRRAKIEKIGR